MSPSGQPFADNFYRLGRFALRGLTAHDPAFLSYTLSALEPWVTLGYEREALARYLSEPDPSLSRFVISYSDNTAGLVCVRRPWLKGALLDLIAVFPPHQQKGLGREVMAWFEGQTAAEYPNTWVLVSDFNKRARLFYLYQGYREVATLKDLVRPGLNEVLLRKVLYRK